MYLALDDVGRDLPAPAAARLQSVKTLLDAIEGELRRLSHELRPTILDDLGADGLRSTFSPTLSPREPASGSRSKARGTIGSPSRSRPCCIGSSQEALTNVGKHAQASAVTVVVRREARRLCCSIRDDGVGFDPGTAGRPSAKGIGLIGIRERLFALGGALSIDAAPGRGTELRVTIPLLMTH